MNTPTAKEIIDAQGAKTNIECAKIVGVNRATWGRWRSGESRMPIATWELFKIKLAKEKQV